MFRHSRVVAVTVLSLALAASAGAQNFLNSSPRTIPNSNFELSGYPTYLVGRDGAPDRFGMAGRLGYGITDSLDISGKAGFFDDFSLVGLEAGFWFLKGDVDMSLSLGAHKALIQETNDTTAIDLGLQAGGRISDRLTLSGGLTASFESIDDTAPNVDSDFTRFYFGPGLRYRVSDRWDVYTQVGIGLTDESPHYFTFGVAAYLPTSGASSRPGSR
jgi:hypothetical protein